MFSLIKKNNYQYLSEGLTQQQGASFTPLALETVDGGLGM